MESAVLYVESVSVCSRPDAPHRKPYYSSVKIYKFALATVNRVAIC